MNVCMERKYAMILNYDGDQCIVPDATYRQRERLVEITMQKLDSPRPHDHRIARTCKTPKCFNRKHLYWKRKENKIKAIDDCVYGHINAPAWGGSRDR